MIIETDFPDHWKTQLLIKLTGSPAAPLLILRFWLFCQQRKAWRFEAMSNDALAAVCRWDGDAAALRAHLLTSGFLSEERDGDTVTLIAHDFETVNSKLTANWRNGPKGGRPRTHEKPTANPSVTGMEGLEGKEGSVGMEGSEVNKPPTPASGGSRGKASRREKRIASVLPSAQSEPKRGRMLALNAILRRPPTDAWSAADQLALEASGLLKMDELDFVDACETVRVLYHATIPREISAKYWKRSTLEKLLENWGGELDKARAWARDSDDGIRKV